MAPIRIALVDDEGSVRVALGRLLRLADYDVAAYGSAEEFLAAVGDRRPDCALFDVHLPGLSGIQLQSQLRAEGWRLPVVFITASEDPSVDRDAAEAGGTRVLRKPFSSRELLDSIAAALRAGHAG